MTDAERYAEQAKELGVIYNGIQVAEVSFPCFSFPKDICNGTTFGLHSGESLSEAIQRVKKQWRVK